jgi:hypothetical protein
MVLASEATGFTTPDHEWGLLNVRPVHAFVGRLSWTAETLVGVVDRLLMEIVSIFAGLTSSARKKTDLGMTLNVAAAVVTKSDVALRGGVISARVGPGKKKSAPMILAGTNAINTALPSCTGVEKRKGS